ncbi:MAG: DUF4175 family protein [Pseudomonadota bacterium]|nr:DUF4175 family protein [Pseudomonadota bacterium]
MYFKEIKLRIIQFLLNIQKNISYLLYLFLFLLSLSTFSAFGLWSFISGFIHIALLSILLILFLFLFLILLKRWRYVTLRSSTAWVERKNFVSVNPLVAIEDSPVGDNFNSSIWNAHILQSKKYLKKISFYYPKIDLDIVDPLKTRYLFILFFIVSFTWASYNDVLKKNLIKIASINFEIPNSKKKDPNILVWVKPPSYTGYMQKSINIKSLKEKKTDTINVPFSSNINIHASGLKYKKIDILFSHDKEFRDLNGSDLKIRHTLIKNQTMKILFDNEEFFKINFNMIPDNLPKVKFLSSPEVINGVSLRFSTISEDDHSIKKAIVLFKKPLEFNDSFENKLTFDLPILNADNAQKVTNLFFKNMSSHIWAGSESKINVIVYDDLDQEGIVSKNIILPEKQFSSKIANIIYRARSDLAKNKISLDNLEDKLGKIFDHNEKLLKDTQIKNNFFIVSSDIKNLTHIPFSYKHVLYQNLWNLALSIEDGKLLSVKNNLEQIEQNLFDSINQRDTDKVSANVEKFKESIQSLLDLDNEDGQNSLVDNHKNKNINDEINRRTKDLEDLLKQGTKQNLNERVHELKQLADSIKNPKVQNKSEILKEQKKREFINKLSELLNKQEIIMEESFNEAANRGKFKQSSEGSGGRTSKEKQENLRNTLGNIMRDIGESENEIPQELGRADRAMRQATRELDNGRPDQASNAQGRAAEMLQRAMNRMNFENNEGLQASAKKEKNNNADINYNNKKNNLEYQGTSIGGTVEIPETLKVHKAQKIAKELYNRFNDSDRSIEEKSYIKNLLDWY